MNVHKFVQDSKVVEYTLEHNGRSLTFPAVEVPASIKPNLFELYKEACNVRETMIKDLWLKKNDNPNLKLMRRSWFLTNPVEAG